MSLSKIYKGSPDAAASAMPLVMECFRRPQDAAVRGAGRMAKVGDEILEIEREAYEKGFAAGERAGFEFGSQKAEAALAGLKDVLDEIASFREILYKAVEAEIAGLAIAVARKVVRREVEMRRDVVVESVKAALSVLASAGSVTVKVNPLDLEVMHQFKKDLEKYSGSVKGVSVDADETISRGGCIIETNYGEVDATIEGVFAEIEEKLKDGDQ